MDKECAAAEARGLRLDEPEHQLHRDRRVDRRAALTQNLAAGLGRERMRGHRHVPRANRESLRLAARRGFWRRPRLLCCHGNSREQQ